MPIICWRQYFVDTNILSTPNVLSTPIFCQCQYFVGTNILSVFRFQGWLFVEHIINDCVLCISWLLLICLNLKGCARQSWGFTNWPHSHWAEPNRDKREKFLGIILSYFVKSFVRCTLHLKIKFLLIYFRCRQVDIGSTVLSPVSLTPVNSFSVVSLTPVMNFRILVISDQLFSSAWTERGHLANPQLAWHSYLKNQ